MLVAIFMRKEFYAVYIPQKTTIHLFIVCISNLNISLLGHCYKKVIQETEEIQEVILKDMETKPIDKEVIVLYEGENVEKEDEEMFKVGAVRKLRKNTILF